VNSSGVRTEHHEPVAKFGRMPYDIGMSTREVIARELERLPEQDLDKLLCFLRSLKEAHAENAVPTLAAESALAKDWLTPEEDAAWARL
jgi:hypothetical protein